MIGTTIDIHPASFPKRRLGNKYLVLRHNCPNSIDLGQQIPNFPIIKKIQLRILCNNMSHKNGPHLETMKKTKHHYRPMLLLVVSMSFVKHFTFQHLMHNSPTNRQINKHTDTVQWFIVVEIDN